MPAGTLIDIPDHGGLVCGFALRGGGEPATPLASPTAGDPGGGDGGAVWLHFNLGDTRARNWIAACPDLPQAARDALLADDAHVRLSRVGDGGVAGVLGDLHYDYDDDPDGLGVIRLYADDRRLITGRRHPLKSVDRLRVEVAGGMPLDGPMHLLAHLLDDLAEMFDGVAAGLAERVDAMEDRALKAGERGWGGGGGRRGEREAGGGAGRLGTVRRLVARLRRHVGAGRQAIVRVLPQLPAWCGEADRVRFRAAADRLEGVGHDLELVQERARLLQEELAERQREATNRNLYVLSIVTTIFMPITLITGIFGMNVGGLPWLDSTGGFWWVMTVIAATAVGSLLILRRRRFL